MRRTTRIGVMSGSTHLGHNRVPNQLRGGSLAHLSLEDPRPLLAAGSLLPGGNSPAALRRAALLGDAWQSVAIKVDEFRSWRHSYTLTPTATDVR